MASAAIIETEERVKEVHIEGLALLKIVKHCHDCLPHMVTGSLLGLVESGSGILEITHAFPLPESRPTTATTGDKKADLKAGVVGSDVDEAGGGGMGVTSLEGHEFQMEMMRMLREVNVDNNCVGWYQSMYLGIYSTSALLENQWSYQTDLSANAVVLLYDPMQTSHGNLVLHCYRLTEKCLELKTSGKNVFIDPNEIFEQVPVKFVNPGLVRALLSDIAVGTAASPSATTTAQQQQQQQSSSSQQSSQQQQLQEVLPTDTTFDRLDLSTNPYLEKHLEFLCSWVDDLSTEQQKFQYYTRHLQQSNRNNDKNKGKSSSATAIDGTDKATAWTTSNDAPRRMESLLINNQIRTYCNQIDKFAGGGLGKLFLAGGLHKEEKST